LPSIDGAVQTNNATHDNATLTTPHLLNIQYVTCRRRGSGTTATAHGAELLSDFQCFAASLVVRVFVSGHD
jgi:hypothetical protein